MEAISAGMLNTYIIAAAMGGIRLEKVELEREGELDLHGHLEVDEKIFPGYKDLIYKVRWKWSNSTRGGPE